MRHALLIATLPLLAPRAHAACGDGVIEPTELCDDHNLDASDGCDASCQTEPGWDCVRADLTLLHSEILVYDGAGPSWTLSTDGLTLTQSADAAASLYVSTLPAAVTPITFEASVTDATGDDFIGFAVGYTAGDRVNPSAEWILFDWKKAQQSGYTRPARAGLVMSRVTGALVAVGDLWDHTGAVTEIARATSLGSTGWASGAVYTVTLDYSPTAVRVWVNGALEFDVTGTFPDGNLGLYAYSQPDVRYTLLDPAGRTVCVLLDTDDDGLTDLDELGVFGTDPTRSDTDGDSLSDPDELLVHGTDPNSADTDSDGLSDAVEVADGLTDPIDPDTDSDGLNDGDELLTYGSDPNLRDTDSDTLHDGVEVHTYGSNPVLTDSDGDTLPDGVEVRTHLTNPAAADTDGDGLDDDEEIEVTLTSPLLEDTDFDLLRDLDELLTHLTDPLRPDTDTDGLYDGDEVLTFLSDPNVPDTDGDTLSDGAEVLTHLTDPTDPDTDGDTLTDDAEVLTHLTDPTDPDTDGDTLTDNAEVRSTFTDPLLADTDNDGLSDGAEVQLTFTDPLAPDTDAGGVSDGDEALTNGTDPLDPSDDLLGPDTDPPIEGDTDREDTLDPEDEGKEGRGCSCSTGPTGSTAGGGLFGALLGLVLRRRRR